MRKSVLRKLAALGLSLLVGWSLSAQQRVTLSGQVVDDGGEPMIGVGVVQQGTTNGVITDLDGNYAITVPAGATVVFSSVGYVTQEVVATSTRTLNIVMPTDTQMIEETVVVGYGVQRKSDVTGAISQVKEEDIQNRTITSPESALQGKTAGVQVYPAPPVRAPRRASRSAVSLPTAPPIRYMSWTAAGPPPSPASTRTTSSRWKSSRTALPPPSTVPKPVTASS